MQRANIVNILIDDLGCCDLGCFGSTFYETPTLDALARQGMKFTNAYASAPVCSPTRASIMCGKSPARVGITQYIGGRSEGRLQDVPYVNHLPLEEKSIATALREGGYQTWHVGKWHLGDEPFYPQNHGFDVNIGGCNAGFAGEGGYFSPYKIPIPPGPEGEYLTDRLTDEAIALIRRRDPTRPFFLNLAHYAMHVPLAAPVALVEKYERKARAMKLDRIDPIVPGEPHPCKHKRHLPITRRVLQSHTVYAAMIENLDWNIGRILNSLEEEGLREDTLVVFTSDNGGLSTSEGAPTCNYPYVEGKGWMYEGGVRICQIARWPRVIAPQSHCSTPVISADLYPTYLQAAQLQLRPEQHADGISLLPLLRGDKNLAREALFWHYPHYSNQGGAPAAVVLCGRWKLIRHFDNEQYELFDLIDDPSEQSDLSDLSPYAERVRQMRNLLQQWLQETFAKLPKPNPMA